jgi:hypothetical protein
MTLMLEIAGGIVLGVIALCVLSFAAAAVMGVQLAALWICRQAFQALGNHIVSIASEWKTGSEWLRAWAYSLIRLATL